MGRPRPHQRAVGRMGTQGLASWFTQDRAIWTDVDLAALGWGQLGPVAAVQVEHPLYSHVSSPIWGSYTPVSLK